ncbi:MAG TPA: molybdopterin molybdotransferase MoeA [Dyella sp.]|uniref:molybdopterin molybdotransferase MoeA n=1 Tax=Dyella sp. TaxID=1869338 RepID=UPI002D7A1B93|nr:molybdopterin molybdotransferase MoeA [Dyella sp.]HET6552702.1 molybdopterin molybdotransferase MoeA [Dyella sp.]
MTELISVAQAEALVAEHMPSFGSESVPLAQAAGRILRQAVHAERDQPPFDRVMMDGIAIRWQEVLPLDFALAGVQLAGMAMQTLASGGACLEVTTGAILPAGCDCVIPIEHLQREGDRYRTVEGYQPARGQFIHSRGSDCVAGELLLEPGAIIGAPEIALLAANGFAHVDVARIPSIAIVSTGDELVDVDSPLGEGQIRRSNDIAVGTALQLRGLARLTFEHVTDDEAATRATLTRVLAAHDVVILSGGVSMGQRDYVPTALEALGARRVFHRIAQKPGKPMWFGVGPDAQVIFGLPGNPVSALVCAIRYVCPALLSAMGLSHARPETVCLAAAMDTHAMLCSFVPAHVHTDLQGLAMAHPVPSRTSGDFSSLPRTHGVVQLPPGLGPVPAGTAVEFYRW